MSRKNSIIIIAAVLLLILGGLFFFYSRSTNTNAGSQASTTTSTVNPFGNNSTNKTSGNANGGNTASGQTNTANKNTAKLLLLYANPTSGSVFFANKSNQSVFQFVDRANGNVYQYLPQSQSGQPIRLTNTTIPKVEEVAWSPTGNSLVYRYLDSNMNTIDSFSSTITGTSTGGSLEQVIGSFLTINLVQLVVNSNGSKIFRLVEKSDGSGTYGIMSDFDGTNKKQILSSPISFWNISWPTNAIITFTTKPTYKDYGYLYFFNPQTYSFERVLGNVIGLSTLTNSDGSLVAYSESQNDTFGLNVYNVKNKTTENIALSTLADKCVWSTKNTSILYCAVPQTIPPDTYPDAWYQGTESFEDNIWMIDTNTGATTEIYQTGVNESANIDATDLTISPDDKYLSFSNKNDLSVWLLAM